MTFSLLLPKPGHNVVESGGMVGVGILENGSCGLKRLEKLGSLSPRQLLQ